MKLFSFAHPGTSISSSSNKSTQYQRHPNTPSSYKFPFKVDEDAYFLPRDLRDTNEIIKPRIAAAQNLDRYLTRAQSHREQVAYNHAIHASKTGNLSASLPQNKMGVDPGKYQARSPLKDNEIPEFWPDMKSGFSMPLGRLTDYMNSFSHVNLPESDFLESFYVISRIENSIDPLNPPNKYISKKDKANFIEERNIFGSDVRLTLTHALNEKAKSDGAYIFFELVRDSKYSYDEHFVVHFPQSDEERHIWRETIMNLPRPTTNQFNGQSKLTSENFSRSIRAANDAQDFILPTYNQVWNQ